MKIRDIQTGELYQLAPDSTLEIERTNPFFSDGGEQSLPMELPDTPQNRRLTGHPAELAGSHRPPSDRYVEIEDGAYHVRARQVVLSASRDSHISTSYLLEQSDLYVLIGDRQLIDIFEGRTVGVPTTQESGIPTTDEKIAFLDSLRDHEDPHFDIFPVAMTLSETADHTLGYRLLNARGVIFTHMDGSGKSFLPEPVTDSMVSAVMWLNAEDHTGTFANDPTLNLQKGYYMSPFIRAIYVLEEMLSFLGYTLQHDPDPVIDRMVFVNNTIDAIVTECDIALSDLVPDCSCSDLLDLFRYKFGMEFVCDATERTVRMMPFAEMTTADTVDLTSCLVGKPEIEYKEERQRVTLTPSGTLSGGSAPSVITELKRYADPRWDAVRGGWIVTGKRGCHPVTDFVLDGNAGYDPGDAADTADTDEKKSPDTIPSMVQLNYWLPDTSGLTSAIFAWTFPFIGDERALHSRLDDDTLQDESPELEERPKLDMMLLLPFDDFRGYPRGGLTDYDYYKFFLAGVASSAGIGGSLCYHGADGIFERYWRTRDELTRNAFNTVRVRLLLTQQFKMSLSPMQPVLLHGTPLLIDTLSILLGQDNAETQSTLLSTTIQEPAVHAPSSESLPAATCRWQLKRKFQQYPSPSESTEVQLVYPPFPSEAGLKACLQYQVVKLSPGEILGIIIDSNNDTFDTYASRLRWISTYGTEDLYNTGTSPAYLYITSWYESVSTIAD